MFQKLALGEMAALGAGALPLLVIEHPLGGESPTGVGRRVAQAVEQLSSLLGSQGRAPGRPDEGRRPEEAPPHNQGESHLGVMMEDAEVYAEFVRRE